MMKNLLVLFYQPTEGWWRIKRLGKVWHALLLGAAAILMRFATIYLTSYSLNSINPDKTNAVIEVAMILVPVISWAVSSYLVTSVMDGQADLKQCFIASFYVLMPYIITALPLILISQLLSVSTAGFYHLANTLISLWSIMLLIKQLSAMHDYSAGQSIRRALIIVAGIAVLWFVCFTLYVLTMNIVDFVKTIWLETLLISSH